MASLRGAGHPLKGRDTMRGLGWTAGVAAVALTTASVIVAMTATGAAAVPAPSDLTSANRRAPIAGLPDWSKAGYRAGAPLPGSGQINPDPTCQITPAELASSYGVRPDDGADDSTGLRQAVDFIRTTCSPSAGCTKLSLITLPAGRVDVSRHRPRRRLPAGQRRRSRRSSSGLTRTPATTPSPRTAATGTRTA
ncbi:hypothetical protein [Planotetraspora sp. GP83]|uniref:hypothetical protein n=1 Tax=Planotetraspora sp. GP83 TaxID=3156264 RepID=UPI0035113D10